MELLFGRYLQDQIHFLNMMQVPFIMSLLICEVQAALLITSDKERLRLQVPEICPQVLRQVLARCFQENPSSRPSFAEICGIYERAKLEEWTLTASPSQSSGR